MRRFRGLAIGLALLILVLAGFLFLRSPKPIIELKAETVFSIGPFNVTNTYITSWIVVIFISLFAYAATRRMSLVPRGIQNLFEAILEAIYNLVIRHRRREARAALLPGSRLHLPLCGHLQLVWAPAPLCHRREG